MRIGGLRICHPSPPCLIYKTNFFALSANFFHSTFRCIAFVAQLHVREFYFVFCNGANESWRFVLKKQAD